MGDITGETAKELIADLVKPGKQKDSDMVALCLMDRVKIFFPRNFHHSQRKISINQCRFYHLLQLMELGEATDSSLFFPMGK